MDRYGRRLRLGVGSALLELCATPGGRLQPGARQYGHIHALSGAVIFGILNDVPIDEAMRLGVAAASLTLESEDRVLQSLSQGLRYDELSA